MIKLDKKDNLTLITAPVTDFSDSLGYCEHKIPFFMEGIKGPQTVDTVRGTKAHVVEEEYEKEHFEFEPVTQEQLADMTHDVEFARETLYTRLFVPFKIENQPVAVLLQGRTDKIIRTQESLIVQDDKFPRNPDKYAAELIHSQIRFFRQ